MKANGAKGANIPELRTLRQLAIDACMIPPPETLSVSTSRVSCDGATDIPGGAALGHPRVFIEIDEKGYAECGYCDRRFILIGGPADHGTDEGAKVA